MHKPLTRLTAAGAAVCAALAAASASAQEGTQVQQHGATQAHAGDRQAWNMAELRAGYSADRLLDTKVIGSRGESIGSVENILVKDGRVSAIVIETGGFLDMFDTHFRIPWNEAEIGPNMDYVRVPLSEQTLDHYADLVPEKVATGPREWRVTELTGDYAMLADGARYGVVNDVIIARDGALKATIVTPTRVFGGGYYAFPWTAARFDPSADAMTLPYQRDSVASWRPFNYTTFAITPPQTLAARGQAVAEAQLRDTLSVERLLGMDVRGRNGDSIGEIDNILIGAQGAVSAIVVDAGGILNLGETHFRVPWKQVRIGRGMEHVTVPVAEDNIVQFNLFDEGVRTKPQEWRVTELLDAYTTLKGGIRYGVVQDVLVGPDGDLRAVLVGTRGTFGATYHAFPFTADRFDRGVDTYALDFSRKEVARLAPFRYDAYAIVAPADVRPPSVGATR